MTQTAPQVLDRVANEGSENVRNLQTRSEMKWLDQVTAHADKGLAAATSANATLKEMCKELISRLDKERERSLKLRKYVSRMSSTEAPAAKNTKTIHSDMSALQNLVAEQSALLEKLYAENSELRETHEKMVEHNHLLNTANDKLKHCNISLRREVKQLSGHLGTESSASNKIQCDEPSWLTSMISSIKTELETKRTLKQACESQERREKIRQKQNQTAGKVAKPVAQTNNTADKWILKTE